MSEKKPAVSPLKLQKQLLVAESEINRARLLQEWQIVGDGLYQLADQARSFNTLATSTVSLVAGLAALTSGEAAPATAKFSWFKKALSGARLASTIWLMFRSRGATPEKK